MFSLQIVDKRCFGSRPLEFPVKKHNLQRRVDTAEAETPEREEGEGLFHGWAEDDGLVAQQSDAAIPPDYKSVSLHRSFMYISNLDPYWIPLPRLRKSSIQINTGVSF